jgi:parallel beta-helix repeat protein
MNAITFSNACVNVDNNSISNNTYGFIFFMVYI